MEQITIQNAGSDKQEYVETFKESVLETFMLLFERRELDLCESQLYALHQLAFAAKSIKVTKIKHETRIRPVL